MPYAGAFGLHVEIVADRKFASQGVMIHHHADPFEGGLVVGANSLVQAPPEQGGVVVGPGDAVENRVIRVILFGDEHDIFDLF